MVTHSDGVAGAGATTAGTPVTVGTVTLPRGGPYSLWGVWTTVAAGTPTTAEEIASTIEVVDVNGDLTPQVTPYFLPSYARSAITGDGQLQEHEGFRLRSFPYQAAGGAQIRFREDIATDLTVANRVTGGVVWGDRPAHYPDPYDPGQPMFMHTQRVEGTADTAAETSLGTITLAEKARVITGLMVNVVMQTSAESDEISGTARIQSDDFATNIAPFIFPFSHVMSAPLDPAEAILMTKSIQPKWFPVSIPVTGGLALEFLTDLDQDVGTAAIAEAFVAYV